MTGIPRVLHTQQTHYYRKRVNFNDAGVATGVFVGTLPNGALIVDAIANVRIVFNAATTNVLTVGTNVGGPYNNILGVADVNEAVLGGYRAPILALGTTSFLITADTDIFAVFTQTGAVATTGQADIYIAYAPNNDG